MPRNKIPEDVKEYIIRRYDQIIDESDFRKTLKKIAIEVEKEFGEKVSTVSIASIALEGLPNGTHLHNFFDIMISDFKAKYGQNINQKNSDYLLLRISNFIENEYAFGEDLTRHERTVLSRVLDKREDIAFIKKNKSYYLGDKSKGKLGYFK
jgi:hypothetical protein